MQFLVVYFIYIYIHSDICGFGDDDVFENMVGFLLIIELMRMAVGCLCSIVLKKDRICEFCNGLEEWL